MGNETFYWDGLTTFLYFAKFCAGSTPPPKNKNFARFYFARTRDTSPPLEKYSIEQLHGDEAKLGEAKWRLVIYKFYIDKRYGRPGK